ncbi:MAG: leucine-rich repeat domain-containing protein, partial [Lachnospiraceae bacterium]|nr:leucine-rich repeat domain-containing protein [Lachnospiraceae bacterium]
MVKEINTLKLINNICKFIVTMLVIIMLTKTVNVLAVEVTDSGIVYEVDEETGTAIVKENLDTNNYLKVKAAVKYGAKDYPTVEIGTKAFFCTSCITVELPDTIETIGIQAFAECPFLREINVPARLKYVKDEAFAGSTSLHPLFPESVSVSAYVFGKNDESVTTPVKVKTVGEYDTLIPDKDGIYEFRTTSYDNDIEIYTERKDDIWHGHIDTVSGFATDRNGNRYCFVFMKQGIEYSFNTWDADITYDVFLVRELTKQDVFWANGSNKNSGSSNSYYRYSAKAGEYRALSPDVVVMRASDFGIIAKGPLVFTIPIDMEVIIFSNFDFTFQKTSDLKEFDWETDAVVKGWYTYTVSEDQTLYCGDLEGVEDYVTIFDIKGKKVPFDWRVEDNSCFYDGAMTLTKGKYIIHIIGGEQQHIFPVNVTGQLLIGDNVMEQDSLKTFTCSQGESGLYMTDSTSGKIKIVAADREEQEKDVLNLWNLQFVHLEEGDHLYATTVNQKNEAAANLTLLRVQDSGRGLDADGTEENLSLQDKEVSFYTMQSEGDVYTLELENCKDTCICWGTALDRMNEGRVITEDTKSISAFLPEGTIYFSIVVNDLSAREVSVKVAKEAAVPELPEGREVEIQISANSCIYRSFTPSNTLVYELCSKKTGEGFSSARFSVLNDEKVIYCFYDDEDWVIEKSDACYVGENGSDLVDLKAGQDYLFELRNDSDEEITFLIYLGPIQNESKDGVISASAIREGYVCSYKAAKTGYLKRKSGTAAEQLLIDLKNKEPYILIDSMDQEGFFLYWGEKILLEKGNTYYVKDNAWGDWPENYSDLVLEIDDEAYTIDKVIEKINAIGTVNADSEEAISAARKAYDDLGEAMQKKYAAKLLDALNKLTEAEKALIVIKQQAGGGSQDPSSGQNTGTKTSDQSKEQDSGTKQTDPQAGQNPEKEVPAAQTGTKSANPMTVSAKKITVKH